MRDIDGDREREKERQREEAREREREKKKKREYIKMMANTFGEELTLEPKGCPQLSPENTVVIGLIKLASCSLNRVMWLIANRIHHETVRLACNRFVDALFNHRETYIKPPTVNLLIKWAMLRIECG